MQSSEAEAFGNMINGIFEVYDRRAPTAEARAVWWRLLQPYAFRDVSQALGTYTRTTTGFPPTPAAILALLGSGTGDNRPTADEAWAVALGARNEADTVVWTSETAEAFTAARRVLDMGDEVGARMAFKGAYDRLVLAARRDGRPVQFQASLGWDSDRRALVLNKAVNAGLLSAPAVGALLPPPANVSPSDADASAQIAKITQMLATIPSAQILLERRAAAERARHAELVARSDAKVAEYQAQLDAQGRAA